MHPRLPFSFLGAAFGLMSASSAQVAFSVDAASSAGAADAILRPTGGPAFALPSYTPGAPVIQFAAGAGGLGLPVLGVFDINAYSQGTDTIPDGSAGAGQRYMFSVDTQALGDPSLVAPPTVTTETGGDSPGDVFVDLGVAQGPSGMQVVVGHVGTIDEDASSAGSPSASVYHGLGLGNGGSDNVNAFDAFTSPTPAAHYFSWDDLGQQSVMVGSSDVMVSAGGQAPTVYATAEQLGLIRNDGFGGEDDIDALAIAENGVGGFQVHFGGGTDPLPEWLAGTADMILFSLDFPSPTLGLPDSLFGLPIVEGDILMAPLNGGSTPAIFIPAEQLGLRVDRNNSGPGFNDDLDALDVVAAPVIDCDANGVEDSVDRFQGVLGNQVPYCAVGPNLPNQDALGCVGTTQTFGCPSLSDKNPYLITTSNVRNQKPGRLLFGFAPASFSFAGDVACVQPPWSRTLITFTFGNPTGDDCSGVLQSDFNAIMQSGNFPGAFSPGTVVYAQWWYRDPGGEDPTNEVSLTDAVQFTVLP